MNLPNKINLEIRKNSFIFAQPIKTYYMTPFETAVQQAKEGKLITPKVSRISNSEQSVDYFGYQLATHHFNLKLMAKGMTFRGIKFTDIKKYYGLKGRSAKDCLEQYEKIMTDYKAKLTTA